MGLKVENNFLKEIVYFAGGAIRYIIFLLLPLTLFAQNNEAELYVENQGLIFGIKHIHSKQIIVKNSHIEPFYILNETPFYADSSLVATISFIDKKEEHSKKTVFKTIPTKRVAVIKDIVKQETKFKSLYKHLPFKAHQLFKNGSALIVSATNIPIVLNTKNNIHPLQTRINRIHLTLIPEIKKITYTTVFQNRNTTKEVISTYKRPPPFLLVRNSIKV
jgi:hypothetical protein